MGVVREKDFISHDYDIDFGLPAEFTYLRRKLILSFIDFGAFFIKERVFKDNLMTLGFKFNGERIDICFYHRKGQCRWHALNRKGIFYPVVFDARFFDKPKSIRFKRKNCFLPNPPEQYLEARYGEDWQTPKVCFTYWNTNDTKAINMNFLETKQ